MSEPRLYREAEPPRPRTGGALVVLASGMAMFAAIAASAFVVNARVFHPGDMSEQAMIGVPPDQRLPAELSAWEADAFKRFHAAVNAHDDEAALDAYADLPQSSSIRAAIAVDRARVAEHYWKGQLARLLDETNRRDCDAVAERLQRLARLVPDRHPPSQMAECEGRSQKPDPVPAAISVDLIETQ